MRERESLIYKYLPFLSFFLFPHFALPHCSRVENRVRWRVLSFSRYVSLPSLYSRYLLCVYLLSIIRNFYILPSDLVATAACTYNLIWFSIFNYLMWIISNPDVDSHETMINYSMIHWLVVVSRIQIFFATNCFFFKKKLEFLQAARAEIMGLWAYD